MFGGIRNVTTFEVCTIEKCELRLVPFPLISFAQFPTLTLHSTWIRHVGNQPPLCGAFFLQRSGYICTSLDCLTVRMGLTLTAHTWSHCSLAIRCSSRGMCWENHLAQFPTLRGYSQCLRAALCVWSSVLLAPLRRVSEEIWIAKTTAVDSSFITIVSRMA